MELRRFQLQFFARNKPHIMILIIFVFGYMLFCLLSTKKISLLPEPIYRHISREMHSVNVSTTNLDYYDGITEGNKDHIHVKLFTSEQYFTCIFINIQA